MAEAEALVAEIEALGAKLAEAKASITKRFIGKLPNTSAKLTSQGRKAFKGYRQQYLEFLQALDQEG